MEMGFVSAGKYSGVLLELTPNFSQQNSPITIRKVETEANYKIYSKILADTFQLVEPIKTEFEVMLNPFSNSFSIDHYIGYMNDNPVGVVTSFTNGEVVGLYCGATLPAARKQGVATALVNYALAEASSKGCKIAIAQLMAKNMAANIGKNLGVKTVCHFTPYVYGSDASKLEPES
jgi:GNAT superfamily N-acetyltransferase